MNHFMKGFEKYEIEVMTSISVKNIWRMTISSKNYDINKPTFDFGVVVLN